MCRIEETQHKIKFLKTCIWEFVAFEVVMALTTGFMLAESFMYSDCSAACFVLLICASISGISLKLSHDERGNMEEDLGQLTKILDRLMLLNKIEELK